MRAQNKVISMKEERFQQHSGGHTTRTGRCIEKERGRMNAKCLTWVTMPLFKPWLWEGKSFKRPGDELKVGMLTLRCLWTIQQVPSSKQAGILVQSPPGLGRIKCHREINLEVLGIQGSCFLVIPPHCLIYSLKYLWYPPKYLELLFNFARQGDTWVNKNRHVCSL